MEHADGTTTEEEETYTVAVPIEDLEAVYENIHSAMGVEITEDQRINAESIYSLIRYGYTGGSSSFEGADVPFIGADGFCSPIGGELAERGHLRSLVTVLTLSRESGGAIPAWTWRSPQVHPSAPPCLEP